ncbi:hypothetical protein EMIT079MI2_370014 [Bacillus sp. IT-79MI2]
MEKILMISIIVLSLIMILQLAFMYKLARYVATFLNRFRALGSGRIEMEQLEVGHRAPVTKFKDTKGNNVTLEKKNLTSSIVFFKGDTCATCIKIEEKLSSFVKALPKHEQLIIVQKELPEKAVNNVPYVVSPQAFQSFRVDRVPTVFIIDRDGNIQNINRTIGDFEDFMNTVNSVRKEVV